MCGLQSNRVNNMVASGATKRWQPVPDIWTTGVLVSTTRVQTPSPQNRTAPGHPVSRTSRVPHRPAYPLQDRSRRWTTGVPDIPCPTQIVVCLKPAWKTRYPEQKGNSSYGEAVGGKPKGEAVGVKPTCIERVTEGNCRFVNLCLTVGHSGATAPIFANKDV